MHSWRILIYGGLLLATAAVSGRAVPPAVNLLSHADLSDWQLVTTPSAKLAEVCSPRPDGSLAVAGTPSGYLATKASYENYQLHVEWRWTGKPGNSGVLVHIASGPRDRVWPVCFQIQTKTHTVGDLLPMAGATFDTPLSTSPGAKTPQRNHTAADNEAPAGQWNTCDITCRGDTIVVLINGVEQNRVAGCSVHAGQIGLQLEGAPFALRNLMLTPLKG